MEFKKCCVGGRAYGVMGEEAKGLSPFEGAEPSFDFRDARLFEDLSRGDQQSHSLAAFLRLLSVCHTVLVERDSISGHCYYNAESPDEAALVEAAAQLGYRFVERVTTAKGSFVSVEERFEGGVQRYELLNVVEFSSARKRMSVVVREPSGRLLLLSKGADNVIRDRLLPGQEALMDQTQLSLDAFAQVSLFLSLSLSSCSLR